MLNVSDYTYPPQEPHGQRQRRRQRLRLRRPRLGLVGHRVGQLVEHAVAARRRPRALGVFGRVRATAAAAPTPPPISAATATPSTTRLLQESEQEELEKRFRPKVSMLNRSDRVKLKFSQLFSE